MCVKSWVLWRLVEVASFRVVVRWFSACSGVMPPREKWRRRVLYQWTQAAASRSTSPIAPGAGVAGARLVVDQFCFIQGVQRFGQGVIVGTGRTHRLLPGNGRELARSARRGIGRLGRNRARPHERQYHRGDVGRSPCSTRPGPRRYAARRRLSSPRFYASTRPDEGDLDPASLGGHSGDVRNPQLVEIMGPKMPIDQVQGACMARRWG